MINLPKYTYSLLLVFAFNFISSEHSDAAEFVGSKACIGCHEKAYQDWQGSHHDMSMKHADSDSVLGDFNNASLASKDNKTTKVSSFFKKGRQYWVNIQGEDGQFHDYQIKYTFGFTPLQQYMVEFDDGRVQLIPFAWDSRTKAQGGQRWYNLYPEMTQKHQEFFWTNTGQNWNYMCADCHSTNVDKNFDLKTNSYNTTFSEINVACESCHGGASDHLNWAKQVNKTEMVNNVEHQSKGFDRDLSKSVKQWQSSAPNKTLTPKVIEHSQQVLVCAQCHSRRTQISNNDHVKGNAFGERYLLDLISSSNYHPDGQVYNENFVYGSFLQSKMYKSGVVCSDCHNPHTAELKLPVAALCLQCHQSENYASTQHHKHQENSTGAQCVNCHMPETTYMEVDARRDHGFHIPTPDLAKQLGTPDTCLSCHEDKNSQWSSSKVAAWYPESTVKEEKDFVAVFSAINLALNEQQLQGVASELSRISQTISYAGIIRASALTKMASVSNTNTIIAIARAVKNPDENIRLGAIEGAQSMASAEKWRILSPLLNDKVLSVRTGSAFALTSLWSNLSAQQRAQLTPALNEYITSQHFNNDRSFSHSNRGIIKAYQGKYEQAIKAFKQGITIEANFAQTYLNLSQVYYQQGQHQQSITTLQNGIKANPDDASLPFNLGLAYIRIKDKTSAAKALAKATQLAPNNSHYFYVYGLSLEQKQAGSAYKALYQAFKLSNNPQHLYALCDMQVRHKNPLAKQCLQQLAPLVPANVIQGLTQALNNG
ncbi:ammonia-forming cytochrome c nitrite reductase subunit c552 [Colwellia psychrerythraea]|uniref:Doubled CXXCH domain protein n=1 Tax=Colwellia psychrerythraea TaxID=28229 RepID=A0A099L4N5_COLPS|nr:ammonia-forming cytochrome c nitrite reductase subunit c552 [Colwellia psychrerythraea]KGJ97929.1 doubled CXXCH domain protein [Colwellia psychrerythraea]